MTARPAESLLSRLNWPQVAALAIVVAGAVLTLIFVPGETWARVPWEGFLGTLVSIAGILYGAAVEGLIKAPKKPARIAPEEAERALASRDRTTLAPDDVTPVIGNKRERGSASAELLVWIVASMFAFFAALALEGCGGSAVLNHARAAAVSTIVFAEARDVFEGVARAESAACATVQCVEDVSARFAPGAVALDATHATLTVWVDAIDLAHNVGDDTELLAALVRTARTLVGEWQAMVEALDRVGVGVLGPPAFLLALLGVSHE